MSTEHPLWHVTIERTERITFALRAVDEAHADAAALVAGDEVASKTVAETTLTIEKQEP